MIRFTNGIITMQINSEPAKRLKSWAQHSPHALEAGGVLMGRHIADTASFVIDDITRPMDGDVQRRTSFHRSAEMHQAVIDDAMLESDGTCGYLGEWHTHPEEDPRPSDVDVTDWRLRLASARDQGIPFLFFVIVGTSVIRVWGGDPVTKTFTHLAWEPERVERKLTLVRAG